MRVRSSAQGLATCVPTADERNDARQPQHQLHIATTTLEIEVRQLSEWLQQRTEESRGRQGSSALKCADEIGTEHSRQSEVI